MTGPALTGHCLCGAVTFRAEGPPLWCGHCHCESCRRHTGAAMATFVRVRRAGLEIDGPVASYASSPGRTRSHCGTCGSPLAFLWDERPDSVDLMAALLDDAGSVTPTSHDFVEERIAWMHPLPEVATPPTRKEETP
ncbi:GFA family protein [Wenxinia saemankumensis]|uniref:Uncharacterized conserved protein n=1 Tax=Wenxinia saemankumensis TaxID=1447782 RepID=A0A1M6E3W4_9RHOB|nr:GFA family protein [Wenxinia saemankumensis]SHI80083.1 Uncharacterized conserved protein [Wenxinia saemankumensis]